MFNRNNSFAFALTFLCLGVVFSQNHSTNRQIREYKQAKKKLEKSLSNSKKEYSTGNFTKLKAEAPYDYFRDLALMNMDVKKQRPTPEVLFSIKDQIQEEWKGNQTVRNRANPGTSTFPWTNVGPFKVGGRISCIAIDPSNNNKVWVGTGSGGLWYNSNYKASNGGTWTYVSAQFVSNSISTIVFDSSKVMYVATGDFKLGESYGGGVYKSMDGGVSFQRLNSTARFLNISTVVARKENTTNAIYLAAGLTGYYTIFEDWRASNYNDSNIGLFKSVDGGLTWNKIPIYITSTNQKSVVFNDIILDNNNNLWLGSHPNYYATGDLGGGRIYTINSVGTVELKYTYSLAFNCRYDSRVELATNRQKGNKIIYAAITNKDNLILDTIISTNDNGVNWKSVNKPISNDPKCGRDIGCGQAFYNLIMAVSPLDSNKILIGGVDLFGSSNKGVNWKYKAAWTNRYFNPQIGPPCNLLHADYHALVFEPNSDNLLIGNDGGLHYSTNIFLSSKPTFKNLNQGLVITDIYHGSMINKPNVYKYILGNQDNGTQYLRTNSDSINEVFGGDGGYSYFLPNNDSISLISVQKGEYFLANLNQNKVQTIITPDSTSIRYFINPAEIFKGTSPLEMYIIYSHNPGFVGKYVLPSTSIKTRFSTGNERASAFKSVVNSSRKGFFMGADNGDLYFAKVTPTTTQFQFLSKCQPGHITSISTLNNNHDTLAVTYGNYGESFSNVVVSIDSGITFTDIEGNLPNVPVYCFLFNPFRKNEALIGTEIGVFGTKNLNYSGDSIIWTPLMKNMGFVRVTSLQLRTSDTMIFATTYGRGAFISNAWKYPTPMSDFIVSKEVNICGGDTISFTDKSEYNPIKYSWKITPNIGFKYVNGYSQSSKNTKIIFEQAGKYQIAHIVQSVNGGADTLWKILEVKDNSVITDLHLVANKSVLCEDDTLKIEAKGNGFQNSDISTHWKNADGSILANSTRNDAYYTLNRQYDTSIRIFCELTKLTCNGNTYTSDTITIKKIGNKLVKASLSSDTLIATLISPNFAEIGQNKLYYWLNDNNITIAVGDKVKPNSNGKYKVLYAQAYSNKICLSDTSETITLTSLDISNFLKSEVQVSPNPATSNIDVVSKYDGIIRFTSQNGAVIKDSSVKTGSNNIDVTNLSKGIYFIEFVANDFPGVKVSLQKLSIQ